MTRDPKTIIDSKSNADMFMDMAKELESNSEEQEPSIKTVRVNHQPKISDQGPTLGPKYLDALSVMTGLANIRSIEVELPILKCKVEVTPLTSEEEMVLKSASVSPSTFLEKLDEIIYEHTVFHDNRVKNYGEFLEELYPPDKSFLIWALLNSSYLILPTMEATCKKCSTKYIVDSTPEELLHSDTISELWPHAAPPRDYIETEILFDNNMTFTLGMPSELVRVKALNLMKASEINSNVEENNDTFSYIDNLVVLTREIRIIKQSGEEIVLRDLEQDIYPFLRNLQPKVIDVIRNQLNLDLFEEYMPNFYLDTNCTKCKTKNEIQLNPEIAFFRKALFI